MGLDTVELVMAFEARFGITIQDKDAENLATTRDVIDFIYARLPHAMPASPEICLSQRAFYRLRRAARAEFGVARNRLRPSTPLDTLVPLDDRQGAWERLRQAAGMQEWPYLVRSRTTVRIITAASATTAATILLTTSSYALAAAAALATAILLTRATSHLRVHFTVPQTIGGLAEFIVAKEAPTGMSPQPDGWTRAQVRQVVRSIVTDHLNVDPSFSDDATFIDDLGAD